MIIDTVPDSGLKRRYLAYDLMALDAVSKTKVNMALILHIKFVVFDLLVYLSDYVVRLQSKEKRYPS